MKDQEKYNLRKFVYNDVIEECKRYELPEQITYLAYVLHKWNTDRPRLDPNGTLNPTFDIRLQLEIEKIKMDIEEDERKKILWTGTKGEFAKKICEEYAANKELYQSLRDAASKLFDKYRFDWKDWTKEQCYDLAKKS